MPSDSWLDLHSLHVLMVLRELECQAWHAVGERWVAYGGQQLEGALQQGLLVAFGRTLGSEKRPTEGCQRGRARRSQSEGWYYLSGAVGVSCSRGRWLWHAVRQRALAG